MLCRYVSTIQGFKGVELLASRSRQLHHLSSFSMNESSQAYSLPGLSVIRSSFRRMKFRWSFTRGFSLFIKVATDSHSLELGLLSATIACAVCNRFA